MKLQRIRYFVTLAQTLSFSRTAQIHYVSQTTVSQQIRLLEQDLGCELFHRTKRKVELTGAGAVYLAEARRALELLDDAEERVRLYRQTQRLPLRVRLIHGVTPGYIAPALDAFTHDNPEIDLDCSYCTVSGLFSQVISGQADVGLVFDLAPLPWGDMAKVEVGRLQQYAVFNASHPLSRRLSLTREELIGERLLNGIESIGPMHGSASSEAGKPWTDHTDELVEGMDALLLAVSMGKGYTLLSEPVVQTLSPGLGLACVPMEGEFVALVAVYRALDDNPATLRFLQAMQRLRGRKS